MPTQAEIDAAKQEEYSLAFEGFIQTAPNEAVITENGVYGSRADYRRDLRAQELAEAEATSATQEEAAAAKETNKKASEKK